MKVREILDEIKNLDLVMPEFQREYIWTKEQAKQIFVSLFKEYPTGSLLFWKTSHPPELKNIDHKLNKIGTVKIILDGQQRLTTLYLLMRNQIPPFYQKHEVKDDPRNLCFNLQEGIFHYYKPSIMKNNPVWALVTDCFDRTKDINIFKIAEELYESKDEQFKKANEFAKNLNKLKNISERDFPIQTVPDSAKVNEAIDVFDRVNSLGTKLSDSELALAHICGDWPDARRIMKKKIAELAKNNFDFDLTFLVRCLTGVVTESGLFKAIHESPQNELKEGWKKVSKILDYLVDDILPTHAYIHSADDLNTTNVLVPVVVYLSKNKCRFENQKIMKHFIHWIYAAHTWRRYTSQTDQRIDHDISIVIKNENPCRDLIDVIIDQRGRIEVKASDLEGRNQQHPLYRMTYILAKANRAIDWFNGRSLCPATGRYHKIQSHHIFPKSLLYRKKYSDESHLHKKIVNEIANRAFLTSVSNIEISNKVPADYLKNIKKRYPDALEKQFVPDNPGFWDLDYYEKFLAKRRTLIANAINKYMKELLKDLPEKQEKTLDDYLAHGENATVEYKATLRWDIMKNNVNKALQKVIAKSIAGFLNAEGGVLLVGVLDDGSIHGLSDDMKTLRRSDKDGFKQALVQTIKKYLGVEYSKYVHIKIVEKDGKDVCVIEVEKGPEPVFLDGEQEKEFYIRAENTTIPLDMEKAYKYIGLHWEN